MDVLSGACCAGLPISNEIETLEHTSMRTRRTKDVNVPRAHIVFEDNRPELGYDIVRAEFFSDLCIGVYVDDELWSSRKRKPGVIRSVRDMSAWARFKWGGFVRNGDWGLRALSSSFDCECEDFTMRSGFIDARSTDTQGILAFQPRNKWVVLVFRGTDSFSDVIIDLQPWATPHPYLPGNPTVYHGFLKCYLGVRDAVLKACELFDGSDDSPTEMHISGHSLGGAVATLAAVDIAIAFKSAAAKRGDGDKPPNVVVHTFGSPCVGGEEFVALYDKEVPRTFRHVNRQDHITSTPWKFIGHKHVGTLVWLTNNFFIVDPQKDDKRLADDSEGGLLARATDHSMHNYQRVLRRVVVRERIPKVVFEAVHDAWIQMSEAPQVYRPAFVWSAGSASDSLVVKHLAIPLFDKFVEEACFRGKLGFDDTFVGLIMAELESKPSFCADELLYLLWVMRYTDVDTQRLHWLRHAALRQLFIAYDKNSDRRLDLEEFMELLTYAALARGRQPVSQEVAKAILVDADIDHDDSMSFEEFFTAIIVGGDEIFETIATCPTNRLSQQRRVKSVYGG